MALERREKLESVPRCTKCGDATSVVERVYIK
jgi:hypothetical protein